MKGTAPPFDSVSALLAWCKQAPPGTLLDAAEVARILATVEDVQERDDRLETPSARPEFSSWRERLWTVPSETRLGVREAAEALGRTKSFIYARTGPKATDPIRHRKLDGTITFAAGELRAWIRDHEEVIHAGPMDPPTPTLRAV